MVQRSWVTVMRRDLTDVGMLLLKNLFQQEPRIMTLFSLEASVSLIDGRCVYCIRFLFV